MNTLGQAGSGIGGQVSSCLGDGVGNLRDFDDYAVASVHQTDEDRIEDLESQNAQLRQRVADLGFSYKRQIDENKAKQAEQHSKIAHFSKQMQAFREEAAEKDIEVLKLKTVSADTGHEQHVELVDFTLRPPRWRPSCSREERAAIWHGGQQ